MKTQIEKMSTLGRKLSIEIPAEVVSTTMNRLFQNVQQNVELKGFRKGKAPLNMIKKIYADRVKMDTTNELLKMGYSQGLQEHQLNPVNYPQFEFDEVIDGNDFVFSAQFEVTPEVELKFYEGLELEKAVFTVDPKEVDTILENIRKSRATTEEIKESRPAQLGDIATIDFKGFVDGKPLERGEGTDHNLELGSKSFIEGFEDGIVGMTVGQTKTLHLKFPENYQAELSNKSVDFEVTLKKLNTKVLPELNDELVQSLSGGNGTLEDLKNNILKDLEERQNKKTTDTLTELLLKKLVSLNPVEVPASLVQEQKKLLIDDTQKRMEKEGMSQEDYQEYITKWNNEFETSAKEMLQLAYIMDAIATKHELFCNKADIDAKFEEYAKQTGIELARIREHYSKAETMNRLAQKITEEKVTAYVLSKANVKEVTPKGQ